MTQKAQVFAVMNRKGGVGKTTSAVTLAYGLARKMAEQEGKGHVLLVDLDPQGNVAASLRLSPKKATISDVLLGKANLEDTLVTLGERCPNLFILPSRDDLSNTKRELIASYASKHAIAATMGRRRAQASNGNGNGKGGGDDLDRLFTNRLHLALSAFDYIILDCPPSLDVLADAVYDFADKAIVPVKPDYLGTTGTRMHTEDINEAREQGIDIRIGWLLPTFFRQREIVARQMLESLIRHYGADRVAPPVPQAAAVEQASAMGGLTIFEYAPDNPASEAYRKFVEIVYAATR